MNEFPQKNTVRSKFDSPLVPFLIALILGFSLLLQGLVHSRFNATVFVGADVRWSDARVLGPDFIIDKSAGYDGQFYYRLARDPFTSTRTAHGVTLDVPAYRQQRILYPVLAWCFSLGQAAWTPWALIAVNLLGFCAIGWFGGAWAQHFGEHAMWGALPLFHLGFVFSLTGNLAEIVEIAALLAGLLLVEKRRYALAALWIGLAILAKETALLAALAVAGSLTFNQLRSEQRHRFDFDVLWLLIPLAIYASVQLVLQQVWGVWPSLSGSGNIVTPLMALASYLATALGFTTQSYSSLELVRTIGLLAAISFIALVAFHIQRSAAAAYLKIAWGMFALLFLSLSEFVLSVDVHFARAFSECFVLGVLLLLAAPLRTRFMLLFCLGALFYTRSLYTI